MRLCSFDARSKSRSDSSSKGLFLRNKEERSRKKRVEARFKGEKKWDSVVE
jgi:hypothetical protein